MNTRQLHRYLAEPLNTCFIRPMPPLTQKEKKESDSFRLLNSIYKIALLLKESGRESDLPLLLNSIYKIALLLKESGRESDLPLLLNSIYKIALLLKESIDPQDRPFSYMNGLQRIIRADYFKTNQEKILEGLDDATSFGQLKSKKWLLQVLKEKNQTSLGTVFVCAGWYGILPLLLLGDEEFSLKNVFLFDKDPLSIKVSEDINRPQVKGNWKFKATEKDILSLNYDIASFKTLKANGEEEILETSPDTIINTSCEHIKDFSLWWRKIPEKKLVILQSNNYFDIPFHVNCSSSLEEFKKNAPMKNLLYEGELDLDDYKRFLLVGFK